MVPDRAARIRRQPHVAEQLGVVLASTLHTWRQPQALCLLLRDLLCTAASALLLGLLQGPQAWSPQGWQPGWGVPAAALVAVLALGLLSAAAAAPVLGGDRAAAAHDAVAGLSTAAHCLGRGLVHLPQLVLRPALFLGLYCSLTLPAVDFGKLYGVGLLVCWWCAGLAHLAAAILPLHRLQESLVAAPLLIGGVLNGVFPTLTSLQSSPWFLVAGGLPSRCTALCLQRFRCSASLDRHLDDLLCKCYGQTPRPLCTWWLQASAMHVGRWRRLRFRSAPASRHMCGHLVC